MKSVIAKVQIQFDVFENDLDKLEQAIQNELENLNRIWSEARLDSQPQMFINNIDKSDIEVADEEIEDNE